MTTKMFDLGIRLKAHQTGQLQPRLTGTPWVAAYPLVALDVDGKTVTVQHAGGEPMTGTGAAGFAPLIQLVPEEGNVDNRPVHTLVVRNRRVVTDALGLLADTDGIPAGVGLLLRWWDQRLAMPDSQAAVAVIAACKQRWVTGEHLQAEADLSTWARWFDVPTVGVATTGVLLTLAAKVRTGPPLDGVYDGSATLTSGDGWAWRRLARDVSAGWHAKQRDPRAREAMTLLAANRSVEQFDQVLREDPVWQARSRWEGTVVTGTVGRVGTSVTVVSHQTECKYRVGQTLQLRSSRRDADGAPTVVTVEVETLTVDRTSGAVSLTVRGQTRKDVGRMALLRPTDDALLLPRPSSPAARGREAATVAGRLAQDHWVQTGQAGPTVRRDVPLDVIVAAHGAD